MDYNQTLNLPKTDFPMRAGFPFFYSYAILYDKYVNA